MGQRGMTDKGGEERAVELERRARNLGVLGAQDLVDALNEALANRGWGAAKGRYLLALRAELADRGLALPIEQQDGIYVFGFGRRYAIADGHVSEVPVHRRPR